MFQKNQSIVGQTLPDFAIGFGIFMIAVLLAFSSTTTLFEPYDVTQDSITNGDRVANSLVQSELLSETSDSYNLDPECTTSAFEAFKGNSPTLYDKCQYSSDIDDVSFEEYLGISDAQGINVLIIDQDGNIITENNIKLQFGDSIPDVANTTNAFRLVSINSDIYRLKVTIW